MLGNRISRLLGWSCLLLLSGVLGAQSKPAKPGIKNVQVPFASLKPSATFKIGGTADWVLITDDAVWAATTKPFALVRVDPATNEVVARISITHEACSGLAFGFHSVWVPICGKHPALVRVDVAKNKVVATLPIPPAGPEGGIAVSGDSVWMATDKNGTLVRIDPATNSVRQRIQVPPGSYNPIFSNGVVWITGVETNILTSVDATTGKLIESVPVGPRPRFLTSGGGSIWTLNQGDGTLSRVDETSRKVVATIQVGIPGMGGDIAYAENSVWPTVLDVPLTRIDVASNKVVKQWVGKGGDSLRFGHNSLWITDYKQGVISRISIEELLSSEKGD